MIMFVSKQHFLFIFFSVYKHRLTNTAPYAKGYENINFQAELSQKYKAGNRGVGKKFACKSEKRLFGLGPFDTFDVCVCVCACVWGLCLAITLWQDYACLRTASKPTPRTHPHVLQRILPQCFLRRLRLPIEKTFAGTFSSTCHSSAQFNLTELNSSGLNSIRFGSVRFESGTKFAWLKSYVGIGS